MYTSSWARYGPSWRSVAPVIAALAATLLSLLISDVVAAAPCWQAPVAAPVVDPYREPACRWCPGNRGIEYRTTPGVAVRAVSAGRVVFAGAVAGERYVVVRHADGWRTTYGDLATLSVTEGDVVVARTIVGLAGRRLHFGVRDADGYRDPAPFIGQLVARPRLIPTDGSPGAPAGRLRVSCAAAAGRVTAHRVGGDRFGARVG